MKSLLLALTLMLSMAAQAEIFTVEQILDDTGRNFNPGDFITMNISPVDVMVVEMDCKGYRGAVATLYIDGVAHGSKRLTTWRRNYVWNVGAVRGSKVDIRFTDIDPIVYSTKLTYEAPVEVVVETQIEYIEIEVAKRNLHEVGISMLSLLDKIYDRVKLDDFYGKMIDEGLRIAEELVYAGSNSDDSDASIITQREAVSLVNTLDCSSSRRVLRQISRVDRELKQLVRKLRTDLSLTREHLDHHNDECTAYVDSML